MGVGDQLPGFLRGDAVALAQSIEALGIFLPLRRKSGIADGEAGQGQVLGRGDGPDLVGVAHQNRLGDLFLD